MPTHRPLAALLGLIFSCLIPSHARALSLLEAEEMALDVGAFARTRLTATSTDGAPLEPGADVIMARLLAHARFEGLGHALLIIETIKQPSVFDAFIDVDLGSPVGLTLGLMRMPLSREMLINIPVIPAYDRAWLSSTLAPRRRTGALLHGTFQLGEHLTFLTQLGAFNPTNATRAGEDGMLLIGALDITHSSHLNLHVAGMTHALEPALAPITEGVVYPPGEQLDVSLFFDGEHLRVLGEVLLVKPEVQDADMPLGLHGFMAYRFTPTGHRFAYEPAVSADYVALPDGSDIERVTANMHWLLRGRHLQASLGYGWESRLVNVHRMLGELQIMF